MIKNEELKRVMDTYGDMIMRICLVHLKNKSDAEDIFQSVFFKYYKKSPSFESYDHEKAWFIRVTINECKDLLKSFYKNKVVSLDELDYEIGTFKNEHKEVLEAVLNLEAKYRNVIYLYYYEGYKASEIAEILHKNANSVYTLINRAKLLLKEVLKDEE